MQERLKHKLLEYIRQHNPEIVLIQEENLSEFLSDKIQAVSELLQHLQHDNKPEYIIEELCFNELIKDLKPSRFDYISSVLADDFEFAYSQFEKLGVLEYEVVNLIARCESLFDAFDFSEDKEDDRQIRYAITGIIGDYLEGK